MDPRKCKECGQVKPPKEFLKKINSGGAKDSDYSVSCSPCRERMAERQRKHRKRKQPDNTGQPGPEEDGGGREDPEVPVEGFPEGQPAIALEDLLARLREAEENPCHLQNWKVDVGAEARVGRTRAERAHDLSANIGEAMLLRWAREGKKKKKRTGATVYSYSCCQSADRDKKPKVDKGDKARDRRRMSRFACHGWLHLRVSDASDVIDVTVKHLETHLPYTDIELPEEWKRYIEKQAEAQVPGDMWSHITNVEMARRRADKSRRPITFTEKSVYYYWQVVTRKQWRLAGSPLESAREFLKTKGEEYDVVQMEIEAEPGTELVAFYVKDFIDGWAANTQELAMDSTWNTNGGNFELFAAVADADGFGLPLAFLFIRTTEHALPGAKQTVLERFLGQLKDLGVKPEFTLSDKDWSEIGAMRATWDEAKHQLCFWHGLRACKQRLTKNKSTPAPYNSQAANHLFSFIDTEFVPASQRPAGDTLPPPPARPLRRVRLTLDHIPPVETQAVPPIRLSATAIANALREDSSSDSDHPDSFDVLMASTGSARPSGVDAACRNKPPVPEDSDAPAASDDDERSESGMFWTDEAEAMEASAADDGGAWYSDAEWDAADSDAGDLRHEVEALARDNAGINQADALPSESGPRPTDPAYQFCPAAHRIPIYRLYAKHASLHPLLPERHLQPRSAENIHRDAVSEMYHHCHLNHLAEVWAYLWNSWYRPERWVLWARSACPSSIPRKRTTMIVEALWRGIKRQVLPRYNRPAVDFAQYSIITKGLTPYRLKLEALLKNPRASRAARPSNVQKDLRRAWKRLARIPIVGSYRTSLARWTCTCGNQKFHAHLLCKHLVKAAGPMSAKWWVEAVRYHIPPFYVVPINGVTAPPPESMRDHSWIARMRARPPIVRPVVRAAAEDTDVNIPDVETDGYQSTASLCSSPGRAPPTGSDGMFRTRAGDGAGFELDDEDQREADEVQRLLHQAIAIYTDQERYQDALFLPNAKKAARSSVRWILKTARDSVQWSGSLSRSDVQDWEIADIKEALARGIGLVQERRDLADSHIRVAEAKKGLKGVLRWTRDLERHKTRRTLPMANAVRRGDPKPTYVYGYH